jgi:hypothetical protein
MAVGTGVGVTTEKRLTLHRMPRSVYRSGALNLQVRRGLGGQGPFGSRWFVLMQSESRGQRQVAVSITISTSFAILSRVRSPEFEI